LSNVNQPAPTDAQVLFVYGSLLQELLSPTHRQLLQATTFLGRGCFPGRLYELGNYPGAILDESSPVMVRGQLLLLPDDEILKALDSYEGCSVVDPLPHEYSRTRITILLDNHDSLLAWTYLYILPTEKLIEIPGGDYLLWRRNKTPA
jgi:gamma-glutamylcyclotransferase (GGCT)/AIG2-like uncharacterized protein YtfP